jgi:hypothetical protein
MNSIIGTLVNGEINNKTKKIKTELTFVVVLVFYVWLIGKTIIFSKIVYVSRENMESKDKRMFHKLKGRFSYFFQFSKNRQ